MSELQKGKIPSYLETPPKLTDDLNIPTTKLQELPFEKIRWQAFEKLCLRLARGCSEVEFCRFYGKRGDEQKGIDLYARSYESEKYIVYQCKRVKNFGPQKIKNAVESFINGDWAAKTEKFVLCTSESLGSQKRTDEVEKQRVKLDEKGIQLEIWDRDELSNILKSNPKLVNDFFGRNFVELFNGEEAAKRLKSRLDLKKLSELREHLRSLYEIVFTQHDPGIPTLSLSNTGAVPILERFIEPDVYERREFETTYDYGKDDYDQEEIQRLDWDQTSDISKNNALRTEKARSKSDPSKYKQRISLSEWVTRNKRSILLGDPGSGKSTLLRVLALDLLSDEPTLGKVAQKWGGFIPVWLPFGLWTKIIEQSPGSDCSVSDLLQNWLSNLDEDRIWPLLEQALEDERLLLLVDGLDEWTDESSGVVAIRRLHVFVKQRNISTIVSSRPLGYKRLQFQDFDWQIGELAEFNDKQQEDLIRLWFKIWEASFSKGSENIQSGVDNFINELQRASDLHDLVKIPLLLSLLITLKIQSAQLPTNRFLAYDKLVELLIATHPKRRRQAASLNDKFFKELTNLELREVLSRLAFYILQNHTEGVIEVDDAINVVESYLIDEENGLGLIKRDASRLSNQILDVGQGELGIIVQVSQNEIAFFHRIILQYLAAYHLAKLPHSEQEKVILSKCIDLQWFETTLALFYLTRQKNVVKQLINNIRELEVNKIDERKIQLLLSEVAFGDFNCPPSLIKEISEEIFDEIELGRWKPHKKRLLHRALNGLESSKVKNRVEEKIYEWFPSKRKWRPALYNAMYDWPANKQTFRCLWRGLHDEELSNKRAAVQTLSSLFQEDSDVHSRIANLAVSDADIETKAVAIEGLIIGWPQEAKSKKIISSARQSKSPIIKLLGIYGLVKTNNLNENLEGETKELIKKSFSFSWDDILIQLLMEGWPQSPQFKKITLESLTTHQFAQDTIERSVAYQLLLSGYPGDSDVVDFCVDELNNEDYPFNTIRDNSWQLLKENFRDEEKIIEAVNKNRDKFEHDPIATSYSALIGRTTNDKKALIEYYKNKSFPFWAASALLEGWGIEDSEVRNLLKNDALGEIKRASQISHLLPQIIPEKEKCKKRLLEILNSGKNIRYDFVIQGLTKIVEKGNWEEIVNSLIQIIKKKDVSDLYLESAKSQLIRHFSNDQRVKEIALKEFDDRNGNLSAVAAGYANDSSMRQRIVKQANPLPSYLRTIITERLSEHLGDLDFRKVILSKYDYETDPLIKTQASIAYHTLLKTEKNVDKSHLDYLKETISCYGPDHIERRQAALCGLIILKKLDLIFDINESIGDDHRVRVSLRNVPDTNIPLLKIILKNWQYLRDLLGEELIPRLSKNTNDENYIWQTLSFVADSFPKPREEVLNYIEKNPESSSSLAFINFVARASPQSDTLLRLCLNNITGNQKSNSVHYRDTKLDVSFILGTHFKGREDVREELLSMEMNSKVFFALLIGWSESVDIGKIFSENRDKLSYNVIINAHAVSQQNEGEQIIEWVKHLLENPIAPYVLRTNLLWQPIVKQINQDSQILDECFKVLRETEDIHLKISLLHLIYKSTNIFEDFRGWALNEIDEQLTGDKVPDDGFDLLDGEYHPLLHILYQIFDTRIEQNVVK